MSAKIQAYAKIAGLGWEYYMTKPKIILGRGGSECECDVVLSRDSAVSRQHFSIRFAPEHQAIEVENYSKNGILVNGDFIRRYSAPILLRSQAEIAYGKLDHQRITLLLPVANRGSVQRKKSSHASFIPLIQWIGEILVSGTPSTPSEITTKLRQKYSKELQALDNSALANSVRHILTQNDHVFCVVEDDTKSSTVGNVAGSLEMGIRSCDKNDGTVARYGLRPEEKGRFVQFAQTAHARGVFTTIGA